MPAGGGRNEKKFVAAHLLWRDPSATGRVCVLSDSESCKPGIIAPSKNVEKRIGD